MQARLFLTYLANLIDTMATVHLYLTYDGTELNPISAWLLQWSPGFVLAKLLIVPGALIFIWWKQDWWFCKAASWILCIEYGLVATYYLIVYMFLL